MKLSKLLLILATTSLCVSNSEGMLDTYMKQSSSPEVRNFSINKTTIINASLSGLAVVFFEWNYRSIINDANVIKNALSLRLGNFNWKRAAYRSGVLQHIIKNKEFLPCNLKRWQILTSKAAVVGGIFGFMASAMIPDDQDDWFFIPFGVTLGAACSLVPHDHITTDLSNWIWDADIKYKYMVK